MKFSYDIFPLWSVTSCEFGAKNSVCKYLYPRKTCLTGVKKKNLETLFIIYKLLSFFNIPFGASIFVCMEVALPF